MDRTRFEQAKEVVLRYYGENGYSEQRKHAIRLTLRIIAGLLDKLNIEFTHDAITRMVAHRHWSYVQECDLRHVAANPLQTLESPEFSAVRGGYLSLLRKMGKAKSTVAFEERENRRLLLYLEGIGIRSFERITADHLEGYLMLRIPAFAKSTGQAIIYRLRHFYEYFSKEKGADTSLSRAFDVRTKVCPPPS